MADDDRGRRLLQALALWLGLAIALGVPAWLILNQTV